MHCDWMQWTPCSVVKWIPIECSGFHEAWLNALYSMKCEVMEPYRMQCILCSLMECSGFNGAWLNALDFMQHGPKHPDWMQRIPCIVAQWIPIVCSGVHAAWWMQCIPWRVKTWNQIECSGFYAAWPKASRLNAVDSMYCDWMQSTPCSLVKWIPIECSGFHAVWLNAVNDIQLSKMNPD